MFAQTRHAIAAVALGGLAFAFVSPAQAVPMLRLTDGSGNTVTVADGGLNDSQGGLAGVVGFSGALGGGSVWTIIVTTGVTKPALGGTSEPRLHLDSVQANSNAAGTLTIEFTETGFAGNTLSSYANAIGGFTDGTVSYSAFIDAGNAAFAQTTSLGTLGEFSGGSFSGGGSPAGQLSLPGSFSITQVVTIAHGATESLKITSFNADVKIPEPAALALLGFGLVALGFARRRALAA